MKQKWIKNVSQFNKMKKKCEQKMNGQGCYPCPFGHFCAVCIAGV